MSELDIASTMPGHTVLNQTALWVLELLMSRNLPWTVRDIGAVVGLAPNGVHYHLKRLRRLGLVKWSCGYKRTLQPTCRFIPEKDLA